MFRAWVSQVLLRAEVNIGLFYLTPIVHGVGGNPLASEAVCEIGSQGIVVPS